MRTSYLLTLALLGAQIHLAHAAPVPPALERAAEKVRTPHAAGLLSASFAGRRIVAVGERGVIITSDDQGKTWQQASTPVSVGLTSIRFVDAKRGWATGHGGVVLATTDAGVSWTRQLDGRKAAQLLLEAAQKAQGAEAIASAKRMVAEGPDKPFFDAWFFNSLHGMVVGAYGLALETTDGGKSWSSMLSKLPQDLDRHLYAIRARAGEVLIAGESGLVLLSRDQGRSFQRLALPYEGSLFTAEIGKAGELIVAGLRGNVWRSIDSGRTWAQIPTPVPVTVVASTMDAQGRFLFANQAGMLLRLDADTMHRLPVHAPPLNGVLSLNDDETLGVSMRGVLVLKTRSPQ
jgi:photosystem II stability/assembly factor-like uncharacterized protein